MDSARLELRGLAVALLTLALCPFAVIAGHDGPALGSPLERPADVHAQRVEVVLTDWATALLRANWSVDRIAKLRERHGYVAQRLVGKRGLTAALVLESLGDRGATFLRDPANQGTLDELERHLDDSSAGDVAARVVVMVRPHFETAAKLGLLRSLLRAIPRLDEESRDLIRQWPESAPYFLAAVGQLTRRRSGSASDLAAIKDVVRRFPSLASSCLPIVSMSDGPGSVSEACGAIIRNGSSAARWIKAGGIAGLVLFDRFPRLFRGDCPMEAAEYIHILSTNQEYLTRSLAADAPDREDRTGRIVALLVDIAGVEHAALRELGMTDPCFLRLCMEYPNEAVHTLTRVHRAFNDEGLGGPWISRLYEGYQADDHPALLGTVWRLLASTTPGGKDEIRRRLNFLLRMRRIPLNLTNGTEREDEAPRSHRFRALLGKYGQRYAEQLVAKLSAAENSPDPDAGYRLIEERGEAELKPAPSVYVEALPGMQAWKLAWLLMNGCAASRSELIFGLLDGATLVWDIATIGAGSSARAAFRHLKNSLTEIAGVRELPGEALAYLSAAAAAFRGRATQVLGREAALKGIYAPMGVELARGLANGAGIPLVKNVGRYFCGQWVVGVAAGAGLEQLCKESDSLPTPVSEQLRNVGEWLAKLE